VGCALILDLVMRISHLHDLVLVFSYGVLFLISTVSRDIGLFTVLILSTHVG
jgi:hypothetical protein